MTTPTIDNISSKKRLLSPETINAASFLTPDEKKQRQNITIEGLTLLILDMEGNDSVPDNLTAWMARISGQLDLTVNKTDIENLATKEDITLINDRNTAQGEEIKQIREEMDKYKKDLNRISETMDRNEAVRLNRMYRTADSNMGQGQGDVNNMTTLNQNRSTKTSPARRNIVIEGLKGETETDMLIEFLNITVELNIIVYKPT